MLKINSVHVSDCISFLSEIDKCSVDLVFADPPFNIGKKYDNYNDNLPKTEYVQWCKQWIGKIYNVVKNEGCFWLAINNNNVAELKIATEEVGFTLKSWVIWYYTFGVYRYDRFVISHTNLLWFVKDKDNYIFNADNILIESERQRLGDKRASKKGKIPDDVWILRPKNHAFSLMNDVWCESRVCGTFKERENHPCQMPEKILNRIILSCTNVGDLVVDPFSGSGTTLAVAKKLKRNFIGCDISEKYVNLIRNRLKRIEKSGTQ